MNKVTQYIEEKKEWSEELTLLRELLQQSELVEDFKWKVPTYTLQGKNVIGMAGFKNYVGLWFFQGVFLKDEKKLLVNAQENKTKGLRQLRFNCLAEMDKTILLEYIKEAIQNQKDGKEIQIERTKKIQIPPLLLEAFKNTPNLKVAFEKLSPGKRKDYANYIADCKQKKTKISRLEKISPLILKGVGLHDKHKNC